MNRTSLALLLLACATGSAAAYNYGKLDMAARSAVSYQMQLSTGSAAGTVRPVGLPLEFTPASRSAAEATVIVTLTDDADATELEQAGATVLATAGHMAIVRATVDALPGLSDLQCVRAISLGHNARPALDNAREATGANLIHSGTDLVRAYDGTGVIAGIFDNGFDPNHLNFKTLLGRRRVKRMWLMNNGEGTEIVTNNTISTFTTDNASTTHGTHTLGCMAGSYKGNKGEWARFNERGSAVVESSLPMPFRGTATGSDIAIGAGTLTNANILVGIQNIVDYAREQGKPAVINLSIGSVVGSHDIHDPFNAYLDELGKEAIICVAAGNDGNSAMSISTTLGASDPSIRTIVEPGSHTSFSGIIDVWSSTSDALKVTPVIYNVLTKEIVYSCPTDRTDMNVTVATSNYTNPSYLHDDVFDHAFTGSSWTMLTSDNKEGNRRYNFYLQYNITFNSRTNAGGTLAMGLIVEGKPGVRVDMTNSSNQTTFGSRGMSGWTAGTPAFSISSMAAGNNVIAVGAWNTRDSWPTLGRVVYSYTGLGYDVGNVAGYSSYGTLADGRSLPHVCAPGSGIISSVSTYYVNNRYKSDKERRDVYSAMCPNNLRNDWWGVMQGTSMACPVVAGGIATWLEANPALTVDEARRIVCSTAGSDSFVSSGNSVKWGAGKFNAYDGLKEVLRAGVSDVRADRATRYSLTCTGYKSYEVFVAGADAVDVALYSTDGRPVARACQTGDTAVLDASHLHSGSYIVNVNNLGGKLIFIQ